MSTTANSILFIGVDYKKIFTYTIEESEFIVHDKKGNPTNKKEIEHIITFYHKDIKEVKIINCFNKYDNLDLKIDNEISLFLKKLKINDMFSNNNELEHLTINPNKGYIGFVLKGSIDSNIFDIDNIIKQKNILIKKFKELNLDISENDIILYNHLYWS